MVGVPVCVGVLVREPLCVRVCEGERVAVRVCEGERVAVRESEMLPVMEGVPDCVRVALRVPELEGVTLGVPELEGVTEGVPEEVREPLRDPELEGVALREPVLEGVGLREPEEVRDKVGVPEGVREALRVPLVVPLGEGVLCGAVQGSCSSSSSRRRRRRERPREPEGLRPKRVERHAAAIVARLPGTVACRPWRRGKGAHWQEKRPRNPEKKHKCFFSVHCASRQRHFCGGHSQTGTRPLMVALVLAALLLAAGAAAAPLPLPLRPAQALPALLLSGALLASGAYARAPSFPCDRPVDLIYVTDESGSISDEQWPKLLRFIVELSTAFPSATASLTGGVALGFVGFSAPGLTPNQIALRSEPNNTVFSERVSGFVQTGGGTRTYLGIEKAQQELLAGRSPLLGVSRLIIVLTDGDTNGGNDGTDLTIAAADTAREAGITVAAVAIGELVNVENSRAEREMFGIANNPDLVFFIKDWAGLDNDTVVLSALANIACQAPVAPPEVNVTITTAVACNTSIFITWNGTQREQAFLGSPVSLRGSVEGGLMRICWSYKDETPLPALPPAVTPASTQCSEALPGATTISTTAAFPPGRDPRSEASNLYVSLTALNTTNTTDGTWSCGGRANITAGFCHARNASVQTVLPGPGVGSARPEVVVTDLGNPGESTCSACPPGGHLLFPFDAGVALAGVCSTVCTGGSQYLSSPLLESRRPGFQPNASGFTVCRDCHPSCSSSGAAAGAAGGGGGSCVAPPEFLLDAARGALLPPPPTPSFLRCSACSGGSLLNSSSDPALVSPSWTAMLALLAVSQPPTPAYPSPFFLPPPALLSGTPSLPGQSGRCLLAGPAPTQCGSACTSANTGVCLPCPVTGTSADKGCESVEGMPLQAPAPRAAVNVATPICPANTPVTLAARSTTLLITLCIPRPPALRPAPNEPLAPSTLAPNCGAFLGTPAAASTLTQLAAVLAVPPATLFLRSCLDTASTNPNATFPKLSGQRYMWGWGAQGTTTLNVLEVVGARGALQNATRRAANATRGINSNCSCDAVATYALVLGAAEPGQWSLSAPGVTGAESTPPLPALTLSKTLMYQRAMTALRILASSPLNTSGGVGPSAGLPLEPWVPPSARVGGGAAPSPPRRRLFEPTGGFSPLICDPDTIQLLAACFDDSAPKEGGSIIGPNDFGIPQGTIISGLSADQVWTSDMLENKNMLTMCGCVLRGPPNNPLCSPPSIPHPPTLPHASPPH